MPVPAYLSPIEEMDEVARNGGIGRESYGLRVVERRHLRGEGTLP